MTASDSCAYGGLEMHRELARLLVGFSEESVRARPADLEVLALAYMHRVYHLCRQLQTDIHAGAPGADVNAGSVSPYESFIQRTRRKVTIDPPPLTDRQIHCAACVTDAPGDAYRVEVLGEKTRVSLRCPACLHEWTVERMSGPARLPLF